MNKWLYSFALVDPLSLNLHLRFYTMVDRRFEQHLVLYNKLFIYSYKWLLPFDWMMNELNLCMPPWCQRELLFRRWMLRYTSRYMCLNEWMNEWSYVFVFVFIYTIIFSFYIKWRRKLKMKNHIYQMLSFCLSRMLCLRQLASMTDKHFLYLCINTLSWTQMSDYK